MATAEDVKALDALEKCWGWEVSWCDGTLPRCTVRLVNSLGTTWTGTGDSLAAAYTAALAADQERADG